MTIFLYIIGIVIFITAVVMLRKIDKLRDKIRNNFKIRKDE